MNQPTDHPAGQPAGNPEPTTHPAPPVPAHAPGAVTQPFVPPVIQMVERRAGFGRALGIFLSAVGALAITFLGGIAFGLVLIGLLGVWIGGSGLDDAVLWRPHRDGGRDVVAIIPVRGVIDGDRAAFVRACVRGVLERSDVKAVVLRVDSPGGSVTASDEIWHEMQRIKDRGIPLVASFGGLAASGGYYVACGADFIMAQQTTVTGSIGVIAQVLTFEGLMDKVGVEPVTLVARRSPRKNVANDLFRSWTEDDRSQVLTMLDSAYAIFHGRVKDGRSGVITDPGRIDELASGDVYTAADALDSGLIDGIGYLDDAIAQAERSAGVGTGSATVMVLQERPTLLGGVPRIGGAFGGDGGVLGSGGGGTLDAARIRSLVNDLGSVRLMYLMR